MDFFTSLNAAVAVFRYTSLVMISKALKLRRKALTLREKKIEFVPPRALTMTVNSSNF